MHVVNGLFQLSRLVINSVEEVSCWCEKDTGHERAATEQVAQAGDSSLFLSRKADGFFTDSKHNITLEQIWVRVEGDRSRWSVPFAFHQALGVVFTVFALKQLWVLTRGESKYYFLLLHIIPVLMLWWKGIVQQNLLCLQPYFGFMSSKNHELYRCHWHEARTNDNNN